MFYWGHISSIPEYRLPDDGTAVLTGCIATGCSPQIALALAKPVQVRSFNPCLPKPVEFIPELYDRTFEVQYANRFKRL